MIHVQKPSSVLCSSSSSPPGASVVDLQEPGVKSDDLEQMFGSVWTSKSCHLDPPEDDDHVGEPEPSVSHQVLHHEKSGA